MRNPGSKRRTPHRFHNDEDAATLAARLSGYQGVLIDIGTGDGRYVQHTAQLGAEQYVIGIDACRENLYHRS